MSRDRGSVTIWAAATAALIWFVAAVALAYGTVVIGRHRAQTAADLAALAGAAHVRDGGAVPCATATAIAARNGGVLRACRLVGEDIEVVVCRRVGLGRRLGVYTVSAPARAGPVERGGTLPGT